MVLQQVCVKYYIYIDFYVKYLFLFVILSQLLFCFQESNKVINKCFIIKLFRFKEIILFWNIEVNYGYFKFFIRNLLLKVYIIILKI